MFRSPCDLRVYLPDEFVLLGELIWRCAPENPTQPAAVVVPRGFITDLASIPVGLRNVLDINGRSRKPAVMHDYLYCLQPCSRKQADELFRAALKAEGVSLPVRNAYYLGVRLGGAAYWKKRKGDLGHQDFVPPGYWELQT